MPLCTEKHFRGLGQGLQLCYSGLQGFDATDCGVHFRVWDKGLQLCYSGLQGFDATDCAVHFRVWD